MNPSPSDTNRSVFRNWCARIDLATAPFILIMIATVWAIISTVSEPKAGKEPPCRTEFGVPKDQEWCDARYR